MTIPSKKAPLVENPALTRGFLIGGKENLKKAYEISLPIRKPPLVENMALTRGGLSYRRGLSYRE